jgi:glycosyltransferase involved in cell wall biosynthesis
MKILVAHSRYSADPTTGENVHVEREIEALTAAGVDVVRYTPSSDELSASRLALRTLWSRAASNELTRLVNEHRPDVVHVHNTQPMLSPSVFAAAARAGVPVVATVHNYRFRCLPAINFRDGHRCHDCRPANLFLPGVVHACYRDSRPGSLVAATSQAPARLTRRHVSRWLAISEYVRGRMCADGFPAERVAVHHNFCPDPGPGGGQKTDEVLYAGKLTADKGVPLLLEAWTRGDPPGRLLIAGRGPLEPEVRALAAAHPRVDYLGSVPLADLTEVRRRCCAAVVPSVWEEPFGLTALEAMAAGVPVVTTGAGGLAEIVEPTAGWVVPPEPAALVAALTEAVTERGARGEAARTRYLTSFTPAVAVRRLLAHYDEVAGSARP